MAILKIVAITYKMLNAFALFSRSFTQFNLNEINTIYWANRQSTTRERKFELVEPLFAARQHKSYEPFTPGNTAACPEITNSKQIQSNFFSFAVPIWTIIFVKLLCYLICSIENAHSSKVLYWKLCCCSKNIWFDNFIEIMRRRFYIIIRTQVAWYAIC